MIWFALGLAALLLVVALYDVTQRRHAILRNFPIVGHFRYWLEAIGPELRQYIVTSNDEELPFSRDQRRWIYASAKLENNYFGFGSDNDMEGSSNYLILKHKTLALNPARHASADHPLPCAKVLGAARGRAKAFRPASVINSSAMSFGSLSAAAVEAINRGAALADCLQNTGEGGVSDHHRHGGDLIWQIGTGYFGCRDEQGHFSLEKLVAVCESTPTIRALEIKLSQGAKPGLGGILPAAKITAEIAKIRGVPMGKDCNSPPGHTAFEGVSGLLDFVELLARETGLPVGIKSAVGELDFWHELAREMESGERGVDFVTIDGGEGGTGAGPLAHGDHVALPFKIGFTRVYRVFAQAGLTERVVFIGSAKLGLPEGAVLGFALGCDLINVAREAMFAVGCIQAQRCHTGHCPTGVATQNKWLMRGLDPLDKAQRFANYVITVRKEILRLTHSCGEIHPSLITTEHVEILDGRFGSVSPRELFGYSPTWGVPSREDREAIRELMGEPPLPPVEPPPARPSEPARAAESR